MDYLDMPAMRTVGIVPSTNSLRVLAELTTQPGTCPHCPNSLFALKPHGTKSQTLKDAPRAGRLWRSPSGAGGTAAPCAGAPAFKPSPGWMSVGA